MTRVTGPAALAGDVAASCSAGLQIVKLAFGQGA